MMDVESRATVVAGGICAQVSSSSQTEDSCCQRLYLVGGIFCLCIFCFKHSLSEYRQIEYSWKDLDATSAS